MEFEVAREGVADLGAPIEDVAQEAIDATASAYTHDAGIDVEEHLRAQLSSRGIRAADDGTLAEVARSIRAGHHATPGEPDDSAPG